MSDNPYDPPTGTHKRAANHDRAVNQARSIMAVIFMIACSLLPIYTVIYFGELIRSYALEMPVYFRLMLVVAVLGLSLLGVGLGARFSKLVALRLFPSSDDRNVKSEN